MNISDEGFRAELDEWVSTGVIPKTWLETGTAPAPGVTSPDEQEADARFQLGLILLESGKRAEAIEELKRAYRLDRENWIIRKQLWALEHPDVFYDGKVDYAWQKAQIAREDA